MTSSYDKNATSGRLIAKRLVTTTGRVQLECQPLSYFNLQRSRFVIRP